ncbi:MAG: hypothetical protein QOD04_1023, partial [Pseudonocardiales bacterium]|nr:hypothetical protein [Pseudonocardiales bacterium]
MDAAANDPVPNDADRDYYDEDSYDRDTYGTDSYGTDSYGTAAPDSDYHSPAPRYRPGRGGYDAEAAEAAAA